MSIKRDYLERLMEEMAVLASRVMGMVKSQPAEARRDVDAAYPQVGIPTLVLDRLDAASIRMMSGDKVEALVKLLTLDAELSELLGDEPRARRRRQLAQALTTAEGASSK